MLPPLVVLWLTAPTGTADHNAQLEHWAADRGYRPAAAAEVSQPAYDEAVAHEIETLLEDARSLAPGSAGGFDRLDQLLQAHPELPQAAWWAAERYALEAQLRARDGAPEVELARRGSELEGERAAAVGGANAPADSPRREPLQLVAARPGDELVLDGQTAIAGVEVSAGRHHAQVFRARRRIWAGWVELGSPPVLRGTDPTPPCSELDLWGTVAGPQGPLAPPGVRCDAWAVANARGSELEISFCRGSRCAAWEHRAVAAPGLASAEAPVPPSRVPSWVTWGALGVGAAASTLLVLWQTGAFDRPAPTTQFVFTGPTAAAIRF